MKPTLETAEFLRNYLKWLDAGAPDGEPFSRGCGLCFNAELKDMGELLGYYFPFNPFIPFNGPSEGYTRATLRRTHHTNPLRIAFCRAMLALHDGAPSPTGTAHIGGYSTRLGGTKDSFWSEGFPVRIKGAHPQVRFHGRWRRIYALPGLVFGFRSGGQVVALSSVEWGAS